MQDGLVFLGAEHWQMSINRSTHLLYLLGIGPRSESKGSVA